jgi:hypothetical protein
MVLLSLSLYLYRSISSLYLHNAISLDVAQDGVDMLATIQVPKNIRKITTALPAPCYPDTRPHSPTSWPITDRRKVRVACVL